jgi:ATP-dependent helicase HrpA
VHLKGLRRLFSLAQKDSIKALQKQLPGARELGLLFLQIGTPEHLMEQIIDLALNRACLNEPLPKNQEEFLARLQAGKTKLSLIAQEIARHVSVALQNYHEVQKKLSQVKLISPTTHTDIAQQLGELIYPDFVMATPYEQLIHLPRYLKGILVRVEKLRGALTRDQENQHNFTQLKRQWQRILQNQGANGNHQAQKTQEIRWQFEELRVALFAQELKTPVPMSIKRMEKIILSFQG